MTTIGDFAFSGCTALTSITIPHNVTTIGDFAFRGCTALTSVTNLNPVPVEIDYNVFEGVDQSACSLKVPTNAVQAYQNTEVWKEFNIEGIEVGIAEPNNHPSLRIYPNPTMGELWVDCRDAINCVSTMTPTTITNIEIFDVMGRSVSVETRHATSLQSQIAHRPSQIEINISHLPAGVYFLRITTDEGVVVRKVVKE